MVPERDRSTPISLLDKLRVAHEKDGMRRDTPEDGWEQFKELPPEAQREVLNFIAFLRSRHEVARPRASRGKRRSFTKESFFGAWRDRTDIVDAAAWVRAQRRKEWTRGRA